MRRILSAADGKDRLSGALRHAENGDLVNITRYRKPALLGARRLELERTEACQASDGDARCGGCGKPLQPAGGVGVRGPDAAVRRLRPGAGTRARRVAGAWLTIGDAKRRAELMGQDSRPTGRKQSSIGR